MTLLLHRMLKPETYPAQARELAPDLLSTWLRHSPEAEPEHRDWEDWTENAAMLHAFSQAGQVTIVPSARMIRMSGDNTPAARPTPGAPRAVMWGMFYSSDSVAFPIEADLLWNNSDAVGRVQDYPLSPVFRKHAARAFHVCAMSKSEVEDGLRSLHDAGVRRGFFKTRAKGATRLFSLGEDPKRLWSDLDPDDDLAWTIVHQEGMQKAIYLQEAFRPTREYRVVVVGDAPVSGAGCIEAYTPLDGVGLFFDHRVEYLRNNGTVVDDPISVERYRAFAEEYAREWADAHGRDMAYSLDLSIDAETGAIVPIEMNPLLNLGLYANDPARIVAAMIRSR